jgi:ribosomal protein L3 glutamine methyltransferase
LPQLEAGVAFGHGTTNAFDESAWLVLWRLDCRSTSSGLVAQPPGPATTERQRAPRRCWTSASRSRKPAAYLTGEAWLQGVPFYRGRARHRAAQLHCRTDREQTPGSGPETRRVLDLCTGNGSLAVIGGDGLPRGHASTPADVSAAGARGRADQRRAAPAWAERITRVRTPICSTRSPNSAADRTTSSSATRPT